MTSQWDSKSIRELFNQHQHEVAAIQASFGPEMKGCGMNVDEKDNPFLFFIFKEGSTPDLQKLPPKIGPLPVRHEFR